MNDSAHGSRRRGTVLIVVAGLAAVLLAMFAVLVRQIRSDAGATGDVVADAQARIMLHAAMGFVLENARLGGHVDGETYGWTDVRPGRDGAVGPLRRGDSALATDAARGNLGSGNSWPRPGSVYRGDMSLWKRPPGAVLAIAAPNPVRFPREWLKEYEQADDPSGTTLAGILSPARHDEADPGTLHGKVADEGNWVHNLAGTRSPTYALNGQGLRFHWSRVWGEVLAPLSSGEGGVHRLLDQQPVADDLVGFQSGDAAPRPLSTAQAWFRVYREETSDHDGDGSPFYDRMKLSGHGVFVVTCGSGASRGFRDWDEVRSAGATDLFGDQALFEEIRAQERVIWYRLEWSGFTGGAGELTRRYLGDTPHRGAETQFKGVASNLALMQPDYRYSDTSGYWEGRSLWDLALMPTPMNRSGTIRWVQRLDREPPRW